MIETHQLTVRRLVEWLDSDQAPGDVQGPRIITDPLVMLQEKPQGLQIEPPQSLPFQKDPIVIKTVQERPAVKNKGILQGLNGCCLKLQSGGDILESLDIQSAGKITVEPDVFLVRQYTVTKHVAHAPKGVGETTPGLILGEIGPQDANQDRAGVGTVTEGDQIAQQITGLLGGQLERLPVTLDTEATEGIKTQHRGYLFNSMSPPIIDRLQA